MGVVPPAALHVTFLGVYLFTWYALHISGKDNPAAREDIRLKSYGRFSFRYLTNWTHTLQLCYFAICVLSHLIRIVGATKLRNKINNLADFINLSVATPAAFVVTSVFWSLYSIDRELVFPKVLDIVIPPWINHSIHSLNAICAIVDLWCVHHTLPSLSSSLKGLAAYLLLYSVCLFGTYVETGIWLYPVLKELTWPMRCAFILATALLAVIMLIVTRGIHSLAWGRTSHSGESEKKKRPTKPKKK